MLRYIDVRTACRRFADCDGMQRQSPDVRPRGELPRAHLQFGDAQLQSYTRVDPVTATRDPAGLLHVTINIRSTTNKQQYVDAYCTFLRGGERLEKLGPQTITLKGNAPDMITFNSTQPADDYFVTLDYAK